MSHLPAKANQAQQLSPAYFSKCCWQQMTPARPHRPVNIARMQVNSTKRAREYSGSITEMAKAQSNCPHGGQILVSCQSATNELHLAADKEGQQSTSRATWPRAHVSRECSRFVPDPLLLCRWMHPRWTASSRTSCSWPVRSRSAAALLYWPSWLGVHQLCVSPLAAQLEWARADAQAYSALAPAQHLLLVASWQHAPALEAKCSWPACCRRTAALLRRTAAQLRCSDAVPCAGLCGPAARLQRNHLARWSRWHKPWKRPPTGAVLSDFAACPCQSSDVDRQLLVQGTETPASAAAAASRVMAAAAAMPYASHLLLMMASLACQMHTLHVDRLPTSMLPSELCLMRRNSWDAAQPHPVHHARGCSEISLGGQLSEADLHAASRCTPK